MYRINGNNIYITKGDSLYCTVNITQDGEPYELQEGDVVKFYLKKTYHSSDLLIDKTLASDLLLYLSPEETKALPVGEYVYDVELTFPNGDVDTFIQGKFTITPEVY